MPVEVRRPRRDLLLDLRPYVPEQRRPAKQPLVLGLEQVHEQHRALLTQIRDVRRARRIRGQEKLIAFAREARVRAKHVGRDAGHVDGAPRVPRPLAQRLEPVLHPVFYARSVVLDRLLRPAEDGKVAAAHVRGHILPATILIEHALREALTKSAYRRDSCDTVRLTLHL